MISPDVTPRSLVRSLLERGEMDPASAKGPQRRNHERSQDGSEVAAGQKVESMMCSAFPRRSNHDSHLIDGHAGLLAAVLDPPFSLPDLSPDHRMQQPHPNGACPSLSLSDPHVRHGVEDE
jgi:hypothetical protein